MATFPEQHRHKIRLLNYSVGTGLDAGLAPAPARRFCYVATSCGLRKGFMDVLETWSEIDRQVAEIHAVGRLEPPWERLLLEHDTGSIVHYGWIGSETEEYARLLRSCRFAHIPTYAEGQMGTLLDAIFSGCVPITTAISGVDERVLEHCIVVEPRRIRQQRDAVLEALSWPEAEFLERRRLLREAARRVPKPPSSAAGETRPEPEVARSRHGKPRGARDERKEGRRRASVRAARPPPRRALPAQHASRRGAREARRRRDGVRSPGRRSS